MKNTMDYMEFLIKKDKISREEIENLDKLNLEIGVVHDPLQRAGPGNPLYYICSADIYFRISEESARRISSRINKIKEAKATMGEKGKEIEAGNNEKRFKNIEKRIK